MSKKELRAEVNAALIQAAATLAAREHEVLVNNFVQSKQSDVSNMTSSIYASDEYKKITSRERLLETFAEMLDALKARAHAGHFGI